jgi:hypothetical protein
MNQNAERRKRVELMDQEIALILVPAHFGNANIGQLEAEQFRRDQRVTGQYFRNPIAIRLCK